MSGGLKRFRAALTGWAARLLRRRRIELDTTPTEADRRYVEKLIEERGLDELRKKP